MNRNLIEAVAEALRENDGMAHRYEVENPWAFYESQAEAAVRAYDEFQATPRPRAFFVEGVQFA